MLAIARRARSIRDLMVLFNVNNRPSDSGELKAWKKRCEVIFRQCARDVLDRRPIVQKGRPIEVLILCVYPITKARMMRRTLRPRDWHTKRGDWDNLGKPICDVANGILWHDDAQIARGMVEKIVAAQEEPPRTEFFARAMPDEPGLTIFEEVVGIAKGAIEVSSLQGELPWLSQSPASQERRAANPSRT